jgi:hypothetical protein
VKTDVVIVKITQLEERVKRLEDFKGYFKHLGIAALAWFVVEVAAKTISFHYL